MITPRLGPLGINQGTRRPTKPQNTLITIKGTVRPWYAMPAPQQPNRSGASLSSHPEVSTEAILINRSYFQPQCLTFPKKDTQRAFIFWYALNSATARPLPTSMWLIHLPLIILIYHLLHSVLYLDCPGPSWAALWTTLSQFLDGSYASLSSTLLRHGISSPPHSPGMADLLFLPLP